MIMRSMAPTALAALPRVFITLSNLVLMVVDRLRFVVLVLVTACAPEAAEPPLTAGPVGSPISGLSPEDSARFERGRSVFRHMFTEAEGLGPRFNENACNACHTFPEDGGSGETSVTKRTATMSDGSCDLLVPHGGENVRIQVTARARSLGARPLRDVAGASHSSLFTIPFLYGLGLAEAVPLETLRSMADPEDRDGDGISGRLGRDGAGAPARFGRKADVASILLFNDSAFRLEMGLTTPLVPDESRAGGAPALPDGADDVPDPEIDERTLADVTAFVRLLAPPERALSSDPMVARGEGLFDGLGCTACHVPDLVTGDHEEPALSTRRVAFYSDFLLHDMGPDLAGTCAPGASPTEYRTEPLMGLRFREVFLHDGRARSIMDAILAHGGEAEGARNRFAALDRLTQEALLRFLGTL